MKRVGFIGWRGMVGSVLMQRMRDNDDFVDIDVDHPTEAFAGGASPERTVETEQMRGGD